MAREFIPFETALARAMSLARPLGSERVPLLEAGGRVLAEEVSADRDLPPFDKSAMDGFACRRADLPGPLRVVATIPAGAEPGRDIGPGECARIMTGAPVPAGADCVIVVEHTEAATDGAVRFTGTLGADNVCRRGEDVRAGAPVLRAGTRIGAAQVALLATVGSATPLVHRRPRVGIVATGSELVEPGLPAAGARIRNSNSYQLHTQVSQAGGLPTYYGIAEDVESAIEAAIRRAHAENDVVILSGGVSVGDLDLVPPILARCGFAFQFHGIAMQPGRVALMGSDGRAFCWGLPGNPVSTLVVFELMVRPFLLALAGHAAASPRITARLDVPVARRRADHRATLPVVFTAPGRVAPVEYHGSAHIDALARADALLSIPAGVQALAADTEVALVLLAR